MSTVIKVENLSKQYQLGQVGTGTMGNDLKRWWHQVRGKEDPFLKIGEENDRTKKGESEFVWALRDINFEVKDGEVLGIIGRNGAGKSTLLKILSRTTSPTIGTVKIRGRIASLLEVGTGFHPELSGRQNIFLNGAILGMTRAEIKKKFDEIVDFAGVERYIDTPVKRYSSGMYVRLAFGVAAHLDPEILIVDEVLAVGDAEFQKKCLGKMKDVSVNQGRTVLFVSHDMTAISTLTNNAILLKNGSINIHASTSSVINSYLKGVKTAELIYEDEPSEKSPKIIRTEVITSQPNNYHRIGDELRIKIKIYSPFPLKGACFSLRIVDPKEKNLVSLWTFDSDIPMLREKGTFELEAVIPRLRLFMGSYFLTLYFSEPPGGKMFQVIENVCPFEVTMFNMRRQFAFYDTECVYLEDAKWAVTKLD